VRAAARARATPDRPWATSERQNANQDALSSMPLYAWSLVIAVDCIGTAAWSHVHPTVKGEEVVPRR
jgi:hypothetical protein